MSDETIRGSELAYNAEKYGFSVVIEEDIAGSYEFDTMLVVRDRDGKLWAATDSGCSCPTPFEDHTWPTDWTEIRTLDDARGVIRAWEKDHYREPPPESASRILAAVQKALSGAGASSAEAAAVSSAA